ncbi:MAG: B12-binding domain-containing protein [Lawsonella clevelandensis]
MEAGLDTAIAHSSKILPMNKIEDEAKEAALDLIWDRRDRVENPLQRYMDLFEGVDASSMREARAEALAALPLMERLQQRIVDGERSGIEEDLTAALDEKPALEIINDVLLEGMKTVGELFGAGQIQLPFVLQSAEIMKIAVSFLEPFIERTEGEETSKGNMLLATVKGDVHDIGKNLVDIILSNNGYDTVNIGIKQPINNIIEAAEINNCDVIGMSGLLVKSTVVMKENLIELNDRGLAQKYPVVLGGAALTRGYVEDDLAEIYEGEVYYAKDAFETLRLLGEIMDAKHGRRVIDFAPESPAALAALAAEEERAKRKRPVLSGANVPSALRKNGLLSRRTSLFRNAPRWQWTSP